MIAAYLGEEKFRDGVRLHMKRHTYGNATTDEFFASLADAAKDPRVLASLRSFVDQQGVPVVTLHREGDALTASQKRFALFRHQCRARAVDHPALPAPRRDQDLHFDRQAQRDGGRSRDRADRAERGGLRLLPLRHGPCRLGRADRRGADLARGRGDGGGGQRLGGSSMPASPTWRS
jgi:hypothetical protein